MNRLVTTFCGRRFSALPEASTRRLIDPRLGSAQSRLSPSSLRFQRHQNLWYSSTLPRLDEDGGPATKTAKEGEEEGENSVSESDEAREARAAKIRERQIKEAAAKEYNRRRAAYKRQVSLLRREYMNEYQRKKQEDDDRKAKEDALLARRKLERQRTKNIRSAENAMRQEELRRQRHLAHLDHLKLMQEKRDAHQEELLKAKQIIVDELEAEAPLWMTNAEEVERAFTHEAEQLLWARRGGYLGAKRPSLDGHYWRYEAHIWDMRKTYKSRREYLLEEIEEKMYWEANIDKNVWTPERVAAQEKLEQKAKLRAMVRNAGRKALLERQQEALLEANKIELGDAPRPPPIPSLSILAKVQAQEDVGSEILLKDPSKFFIFERKKSEGAISLDDTPDTSDSSSSSLGAPVALRDPIRTDKPQGRVFPRVVGIPPKRQELTRGQRKRKDLEKKMKAAANREEQEQDIEAAAEGDFAILDPIDYDSVKLLTEEDELWEKQFDRDLREKAAKVPREYRYSEEDYEWVEDQLKERAQRAAENMARSLDDAYSKARLDEEGRGVAFRSEAEIAAEKVAQERREEMSGNPVDEETATELSAAGVDAAEFESLLSSLSETQLLGVLEAGFNAAYPEAANKKQTSTLGKSLAKIPGLTEEQISKLVEIDKKLSQAYPEP